MVVAKAQLMSLGRRRQFLYGAKKILPRRSDYIPDVLHQSAMQVGELSQHSAKRNVWFQLKVGWPRFGSEAQGPERYIIGWLDRRSTTGILVPGDLVIWRSLHVASIVGANAAPNPGSRQPNHIEIGKIHLVMCRAEILTEHGGEKYHAFCEGILACEVQTSPEGNRGLWPSLLYPTSSVERCLRAMTVGLHATILQVAGDVDKLTWINNFYPLSRKSLFLDEFFGLMNEGFLHAWHMPRL